MSTTPASLIEAAITVSSVAAVAAAATGNGTADTAAAATTLKPNTNYVVKMGVASEPLDPLLHVGDGIFLQTKTAQVLAGVFVWAALFVTCQQVSGHSNHEIQ